MDSRDSSSRKNGPLRRLERMEDAERQAQIARLKEQAPSLGRSKKTTVYAIFGSVLTLLTVAAFYMTTEIYQAFLEKRDENRYIEVEPAPVVEPPESEKALKRIQEDEAKAVEEYEQRLRELKEVDLLDDLEA